MLKVLVGYQMILDPKGAQKFEGGKNLKNEGFYEGGRRRCTSS